MAETFADPATIDGYHAHIYYDPAKTRAAAERLREGLGAAFPAATLGGWHDEPVGPHVQAMYQIAFAPDQLPTLMPFLMLNRMGLTVLVHPQSGRPRDDHTLNAVWLGAVLPVKTEVLRETG